ncbi:carboxypeptidase regulatory-like domain-containing protein [candidate division WOR-3 bacterium]|nr:carboxypeptidase regulatory-like domain-containing protein [candidate division WOR-3 bacterium]
MKKASLFMALLMITGGTMGEIHASVKPGIRDETYYGSNPRLSLADSLTGSISGTVLDFLTEMPISGAKVFSMTGYMWEDTSQTYTDGSGFYTITDLAEGSYLVQAERDGYNSSLYPDTVEVYAGQNTPNINFLLIPWDTAFGSISGKVYRALEGTPLGFVEVKAVASDSVSPNQGSGVTDSLGNYIIEGLNPDIYRVEIEDSTCCRSSFPELIELFAGEDIQDINIECYERESNMPSIRGTIRLLDVHWGCYWNGKVAAISKSGTVLGVAELDGSPIDDSLNRVQDYEIKNLPYDSCYVFAMVEGYLPQYYDHTYKIETASIVMIYPNIFGIDFDLEWTIDPDSILGGVSGSITGKNGPLPYTSIYAKNGTQLRNGCINNLVTGKYWLPLDPGVYRIYATRAGYETEDYLGSVTVATQEVPGIDLGLKKRNSIVENQPLDIEYPVLVRPNPFVARTNILYSLAREGNVTVKIYDVSGSLVHTLLDGYEGPGSHQVTWVGTDSRGILLPSGVYFCRINLDGRISTQPLVLIR